MDNILSTEESTISNQDSLKYGYVYITTNLINNKKYIGVHKSSVFDESYKGSGKLLWRAITKYGWNNFSTEIIKWCYSKEELFESEYNEIKKRNAVSSNEYYNVMEGGYGGDNKSTLSEEEYNQYIQKIRDSKKRPLTEKEKERMNKMHQAIKGIPRSEETKRKSSISNKGQKRSDLAKKHMSENHADVSGKNNPFYGKKHSPESLEKIRKNHKGSDGKIWITNKVDDEQLVFRSELDKYPNYVRGRLRKSQRNALRNKVQRLSREGVGSE